MIHILSPATKTTTTIGQNIPVVQTREDRAVLVVYSGPSFPVDNDDDVKSLQWASFAYFVRHGTCTHDTIFVVGNEALPDAEKLLEPQRRTCSNKRGGNNQLTVLTRKSGHRCNDMESIRIALESVAAAVDTDYEYLVYLNDEVVGPKVSKQWRRSWTHDFTSRLNNNVRVVGLSFECRPFPSSLKEIGLRVETSAFAIKTETLALLRESGALQHCPRGGPGAPSQRPVGYGMVLAQTILDAGYSIASIVHNTTMDASASDCTHPCVWHQETMAQHRFGGATGLPPHRVFDRIRFFKTTFFVPYQVAREIGYKGSLVLHQGERMGLAEIVRRGEGSTKMTMTRPPGKITVVVSHCFGDIMWVYSFLSGVIVHNLTVISHCGREQDNELEWPPEAHVVRPFQSGSVDQAFAYWIKTTIIAQKEQAWDQDDLVFFLRPWPGAARAWQASEMVNIASLSGFSCRRKPTCATTSSCFPRFMPTVFQFEPSWSNFSHEDLVGGKSQSQSLAAPEPRTGVDFPRNQREFMEMIGADSPSLVVPLCFGGSFAVRRSRLTLQSVETWGKLESIMSDSDHRRDLEAFAERSWAALLSPLPASNYGRIALSHPRVMVFVQDSNNSNNMTRHQMPLQGMLQMRPCFRHLRICPQQIFQNKSFLNLPWLT